MKVWIDTDSGTWGSMENDSLVVVEVTEEQVAFLGGASDTEIGEFGVDSVLTGRGSVVS